MKSMNCLLLMLSPLLACSAPPNGGNWNQGDAPPPGTVAGPAGAPAATPGYEAIEVADAGTINGVVSYSGEKKDALVPIDQDKETCGPEALERPSGALLVAGGKVENVVVYLTGVKTGKPFSSTPVEIDNIQCNFVPRVAIGHKGGQVVAKNSDPVTHNTNMSLTQNNSTIMNSSLKKGAKSRPNKLKKTGLVNVQCDLHSWMVGRVFVHDSPYAVLTDATGAFTIGDVPPGEYELKTWHEILGDGPSHPVVVAANGAISQDIAFAD